MKHTPENISNWLPTAEEIDLGDATETLPAIDELAAPTAADRARELRWFLDLHLADFGYDFAALATYALRHGLYPAGTAHRAAVKSLTTAAARMLEVAA